MPSWSLSRGLTGRGAGTATGTSTDLVFTAVTGAEGLTALDVEAAPAPMPGSGAASIVVLLSVLAFGAIRKRRGAL